MAWLQQLALGTVSWKFGTEDAVWKEEWIWRGFFRCTFEYHSWHFYSMQILVHTTLTSLRRSSGKESTQVNSSDTLWNLPQTQGSISVTASRCDIKKVAVPTHSAQIRDPQETSKRIPYFPSLNFWFSMLWLPQRLQTHPVIVCPWTCLQVVYHSKYSAMNFIHFSLWEIY